MPRIRLKRPRLPRTRAGRRRLVQGVAAACVLGLAPATWMYASTSGRVGTVADAPASGVAVVFGAGLWDGKPSPYLAHRLDAAAGAVPGGQGEGGPGNRRQRPRPPTTSPTRCAAISSQHGVPDKSVVSDFAGFDTWDSCVRAKKIFGVDRAVLVSQGFHIRRAVALCEAAGVRSYGVGVDAVHDATWYYGGTREVFAAGKALLDVVFRPDPTFLGPKEPGISRALAGS